MNHSKIFLLGGVIAVAVLVLLVAGWSPRISPPQNFAINSTTSGGPSASYTPYIPYSSQQTPFPSTPSFSGSGFVPGTGGTSLSGPQNQNPTFNGKPVQSLNDVANVIVKTNPPPAPITAVPLLPLPAVADSEVAANPSGVATTLDFLSYFSAHSTQGLVFDDKKFDTTLKDPNGVVLFTPELIEKAVADNDFAEIRSSLLVQKDFANAEIVFLSSIKVTGNAIAVDKETIASEKLLIQLIDKAIAVGDGTLKKDELASFYKEFLATMSASRGQLLAKTGLLSLGEDKGWLAKLQDGFFGALAGVERVFAASSTSGSGGGGGGGGIGGFGDIAGGIANLLITPFGGQIGVPVPCPCSGGYWIIVGPPRPTSLFVPIPFIASPLFYANKSLIPSTWWLGIANPFAQIPCLSGAACTPVGIGQVIIMAGTSLPG